MAQGTPSDVKWSALWMMAWGKCKAVPYGGGPVPYERVLGSRVVQDVAGALGWR